MRGIKISLVVLFVLVLVSIGLNVYLLSQLLQLQQEAQTFARQVRPVVKETLSGTIDDLGEFQDASFEFEVKVSETFLVDVDIPISETVEVPIQMTLPVQEQIDTTVMMTLFEGGVELPVDVSVPVDVEVPIDVVVPVIVDRTIPISTNIPIELDFPVAIEVRETALADYVEQLRTVLISVEESADQMLLELEQ